MLDSLPLSPRTTRYGCGVYEVGNPDKCYVRLFVTDSGRVIPVNHRMIKAEDLMEAYVWGRLDAEIALGHRDDDGDLVTEKSPDA